MGDFGLATAMMGLKREGATGMLHVLAGEKRTRIQWLAGKPVYADASAGGETLGRLLLRQGHLTSGQYRIAIDKMTDRLSANEEIRFGQVVVQLGFLKLDQIDVALVDQVRWRMVHALECEGPTWEFRAEEGVGRNRLSFEVEELVLLAMRWIAPERLDAFLDEHAERTPVLVASRESLKGFGLAADEVELAALLDGKRTLRSVLGQAGEKVDARATLALLLLVEACAKDPAKLPASPTPPDSKPRPRVPFARLTTKQLQAVRAPAPGAEPGAARAVARDPALPPAGEPGAPFPEAKGAKAPPIWKDAPVVAEQAFQTGKYHLETGNLPKALNLFRFAAELADDRVEYRLYAQWAEWRQGNAKEGATDLLLSTAHDAAVQDPNLGFPRYVMGHLALQRGDRDRAARFFRFAVKLDPTLEEVVRQEKQEKEKKEEVDPPTPVVPPVVVGRVVVVSEPPSALTPAADAPPAEDPGAPTASTARPWSPEGLLLEAASEALSGKAEVDLEGSAFPTAALFRAAKPVSPEGEPKPESPTRAPSGESALPAPPASSVEPPVAAASSSAPPRPAEAVVAAASPSSRPPPANPVEPAVVAASSSSAPGPSRPPSKRPEAPARVRSSSRSAPPAAPARSRWAIGLVAVVVLGGLAGAAVSMRTRATEEPTTAPTAVVHPPASGVAAAPTASSQAETARSATASASAAPTPTVVPTATATPATVATAPPDAGAPATAAPAPADGMGEIVIAEGGHRAWIDGKLVGETPLHYRTTCGSHTVRVGSSGKPRTVDVACEH